MSIHRAAMFAVLLSACVGGEPDDSLRYDVVRGDTLSKIAKRHDVPLQDLMDHNSLKGDRIEVGQILLIPRNAAPPAGRATPKPKRVSRPSKTAGTNHASSAEQPEPTASGPKSPVLSMPAAKRCVPGPTVDDLTADDGALLSQGLSRPQVSAAMSAFIPKLDPCFRGMQSSPGGTLMFDIKVACTGRVQEVRVLSRGDWPGEVSTCVQGAFQYIPFPAHDLPDGYAFQYPLSIQ